MTSSFVLSLDTTYPLLELDDLPTNLSAGDTLIVGYTLDEGEVVTATFGDATLSVSLTQISGLLPAGDGPLTITVRDEVGNEGTYLFSLTVDSGTIVRPVRIAAGPACAVPS